MSTLIITITFNSSKKIYKYLESVKSFLLLGNDLTIIENGSPDAKRTKTTINRWLHENKNVTPRVSYILRDNKGFGSSCNYAAFNTYKKYDYFLFLNPDIVITDNNSLAVFQNHAIKKNADIAGNKLINQFGTVQKSVFYIPNLLVMLFEFTNLKKVFNTKIGELNFYTSINDAKEDTIVDGVSGGSMLVKAETFIRLKGFDERFFMYLEDVDFCYRAKNEGYKTIYCPHSVIYHEGGASSDNEDRILHKAWFDSRKKYLFKHFNIFLNLMIQPFFFLEEVLLYLLRVYKNRYVHR